MNLIQHDLEFLFDNAPPNCEFDITVRPQYTFKGLRLMIYNHDSFVLTHIRVGNKLCPQTDRVYKNLMEDGYSDIEIDTAQVAQDLCLTVQNRSNISKKFEAKIFGKRVATVF